MTPTPPAQVSTRFVSRRTVAGLRNADLKSVSLNEPISNGEESEYGEIIPDPSVMTPDEMLGQIEALQHLMSLLESLDERESLILRLRFGLDGRPPKTLEEVSRHVGRTRERVRQIQNRALAKLKLLMGEDLQTD